MASPPFGGSSTLALALLLFNSPPDRSDDSADIALQVSRTSSRGRFPLFCAWTRNPSACFETAPDSLRRTILFSSHPFPSNFLECLIFCLVTNGHTWETKRRCRLVYLPVDVVRLYTSLGYLLRLLIACLSRPIIPNEFTYSRHSCSPQKIRHPLNRRRGNKGLS